MEFAIPVWRDLCGWMAGHQQGGRGGEVSRPRTIGQKTCHGRHWVEPVIGHIKAEHRMGRNYLKGRHGDRINAVLAAAGYNFGLLLRWLKSLLRALIRMLFAAPLLAQKA